MSTAYCKHTSHTQTLLKMQILFSFASSKLLHHHHRRSEPKSALFFVCLLFALEYDVFPNLNASHSNIHLSLWRSLYTLILHMWEPTLVPFAHFIPSQHSIANPPPHRSTGKHILEHATCSCMVEGTTIYMMSENPTSERRRTTRTGHKYD